MKIQTKQMIEDSDWDKLVKDTYNKPYCLQQQNGCMDRGTISITIPSDDVYDEIHDFIPEEVNGNEMCVNFNVWLERDPNQNVGDSNDNFSKELFWHRNFYPDIYAIANDLYSKGLIEKGNYIINID